MTMQEAIAKYYQENDPNGIMNLDAFNDYTVVTGATGTGKSTLVAEEIVPMYEGLPLLILDVKRRFSECGKVITNLDEFNPNLQTVYQPKTMSLEMFGEFCRKAQNMADIHLIIDEIHLWLSKQSLFRPHYDLIMTKRNDGVSHTTISTNTKAIPNYLLSNITHIFSLRYNLRNDIDWLSEYIGDKAEFLLTPDLRRAIDTGILNDDGSRNITFRDMPQLADYGFVYRNKVNLSGAILRGFKGIE